jgi:hypothetical protein
MKTILVLPLLFTTIAAISIECDFEMMDINVLFGDLYTCTVKTITMTGNKSLETVTGTHCSGKTNSDVKQVLFGWSESCSSMGFIPQNIHKLFPNFIGMRFYGTCNIQALTGDELRDYENLEWFEIEFNPVDKIPGSLFRTNRKLKVVSFFGTAITKVGPNLLTGLEHLTSATFGGKCTSMGVYEDRAGILNVIEKLKEQCPYDDDPSTDVSATCQASNIAKRTCQLEDENRTLKERVRRLNEDLARLQEKDRAFEGRLKKVETMLSE